MIYLTAVCQSRDPELVPYVATPIGPYEKDETDAMERGRAFLRDAYATEDIRTVEPVNATQDFDGARSLVILAVVQEHKDARLKAERERAVAALDNLGPEFWGDMSARDLDPTDLDAVLDHLGVLPGDV